MGKEEKCDPHFTFEKTQRQEEKFAPKIHSKSATE
jgi:hypothetical protein